MYIYEYRFCFMKKEDLFKNSYVISLPHRFDRRQNTEKELSKYKIPYNFFDAVNGQELDYTGPLLKGEEGIRQSHLALLKQAKADDLDYIFVLEDDVVLCENFTSSLNNILENSPGFDILYLGGAHKWPPVKYNQYLWKIFNTVTLHAVIIKKSIYSELINTIENNPDIPVDDAYALLQPNNKAYCSILPLAWQKDDYSDIQNKFVKYDWLKPQ